MKYLLLLILFIGCNDKKVKSKMTKVGHYYIAVYKNETLQDAIMRLDKEGVRLAFVDDWYEGPSKIIANDTLKDIYYRDSFFANFSPVYSNDESNHITVTDHWCVFKKCPHFVEVKTGSVIEWADTTSGFDYNLETSDMPLRVPVGSGIKLGGIIQYNSAINDTILKSVWTDGVQLSPKSSKQFDKDTIYIYRDTCIGKYNLDSIYIELHDEGFDRTRMPIISFFDTSDKYKVNFPGDTAWNHKKKPIKKSKQ